ncbi:MAG: CmcI family methyltransferase [Chitinophagaceae bacterium]
MDLRLFTPSDEKIDFNYKTVDKGHHQVTYRGVKAQRSPFDYVIYQMIISEVQPDLIIEIGTNFGGGALYMADLLNNLGKGEVHSIDISDRCPEIVKTHPRIKLYHEGWDKYDLAITQKFEKILVIEDSSHTYENTLAAINLFCNVVSPGSFLIVEDGIVDRLGASKQFHGGPCKAIREFLRDHKDFTVDRFYCDLFGKNATNNVNGYLRKADKK